MNLILQGTAAPRHLIEQVAALARPAAIVSVSEHAFRCEDITYNDEVRSQIDLAAWASQLDYAFVEGNLALDDFSLLAMDMDSTLITIECIDELADLQGVKPQVTHITAAAMRGEIDFAQSLIQRVALLEGLAADALERVYNERLAFSPGTHTLLDAVKQAGLKTLLVSGGFSFFTERIKNQLGFDHAHANQLEIINNKLTGRILGNIVDAEEKTRILQRTCAAFGLSPQKAITIGDGANDLHMMHTSGLSIAFRAKPVVREQADAALNFVGLDGLLNLLVRQAANQNNVPFHG